MTVAVAAYRAALKEYTRDQMPLKWAATQNDFGLALLTLNGLESETGRLEEAVAAFRAALEEYTHDHAPLQWAMTQNNLGTALETLGERESGTARLGGGGQGLQRSAGGKDARSGAARLGGDAEQPRQRA
jgi:tetratricopeptide (TPR) repeat protein